MLTRHNSRESQDGWTLMGVLRDSSIVLGVTGGIAAYKAAALASLLTRAGACVDVVLTQAAHQFIQPLTFSAITHAPVHTDPFAPWVGEFTGHVALAARADLLLVAPATAATIARLALGLSDDLLGLIALATTAPMVLAPAMEEHMLHHPATQEHLATLTRRGVTVVDPERGRLASGAVGDGRMAPPEAIVGAARHVLGRAGLLHGRKVVVTAGGTREPLDPVRYIGNRSSGRMGFALAQAAIDAGAEVTLIAGPTSFQPPFGAHVVPVETTADLLAAVEAATARADILIMAAAVADFRPERMSEQKIKKEPGTTSLDLRLVRNPDILATIDRPGLLKIGFAAETEHLVANAGRKLASKGLAMIVANDAEATIGAEESEATILTRDGATMSLPRMSKDALAAEIVARIAVLLVHREQPQA
jgi:phosphopantothenoylcysteine decarboxylase/phosphopantothenate--cysteine ligase